MCDRIVNEPELLDTFYTDLLPQISCLICRFEWNGSPLYISKPDSHLTAKNICTSCGGELVFELQILPGLINSLKCINNRGNIVLHLDPAQRKCPQ